MSTGSGITPWLGRTSFASPSFSITGPLGTWLRLYLSGAFYNRFNRALRKERRRQQAVELVPFSQDLEQFRGALDADAEQGLGRIVQVTEVIENMDDWTREVWTARQYGYSWREIAEYKGLSEQQAKLRFQYAIRRLRDRLGDST